MTSELIIHQWRADESRIRGTIESAGSKFVGKYCVCPFCSDPASTTKKKSAGIYRDDQGVWRFKCHKEKCQFCGDVFDVLAKIRGTTVGDELKKLEMQEAGFIPKADPKPVTFTMQAVSYTHLTLPTNREV